VDRYAKRAERARELREAARHAEAEWAQLRIDEREDYLDALYEDESVRNWEEWCAPPVEVDEFYDDYPDYSDYDPYPYNYDLWD
jgi:hypothetical protein